MCSWLADSGLSEQGGYHCGAYGHMIQSSGGEFGWAQCAVVVHSAALPDGQMWTDRPTDPWLIAHLSAPAAESLGRSTVLRCSSLFPFFDTDHMLCHSPTLLFLLLLSESLSFSFGTHGAVPHFHRESGLYSSYSLKLSLSEHFWHFTVSFFFSLSSLFSLSLFRIASYLLCSFFVPCESLFLSPFSHPCPPPQPQPPPTFHWFGHNASFCSIFYYGAALPRWIPSNWGG